MIRTSLKILSFLNFLDDNGKLNLINMGMTALVVGMFVFHNFEVACALSAFVAAYHGNNWLNNKIALKYADKKEAMSLSMSELQTNVETNKQQLEQLSKKLDGFVQAVSLNSKPGSR